MMFLSDETFGPVLFSSDVPLALAYGPADSKETLNAVSVLLDLERILPSELRIALMSSDAGAGVGRILRLDPDETTIVLFQEARERVRISGTTASRKAIQKIFSHIQES